MSIEEFNPDNKIVFRSGGYETIGYAFKALLDAEGIAYYSTDESKFRDDDFILYFKDVDFAIAISMYNKFLDEWNNSDGIYVQEPDTGHYDESSDSRDFMTRFMRNDRAIFLIALIILFLGMSVSYMFNK